MKSAKGGHLAPVTVFNVLCSVVVLALTDFLSLLDGQLSFDDCQSGFYGGSLSSNGTQDCGLKMTLFYIAAYIIRFTIGVQVVRIAINFAQLASGKTNALYAQICLSLDILVFAIFIKNVVRTFAGTDWITATDGRHPVYTNQNDPSQRPVIFACYILAIVP
ncbi:hypothetical protein AAVH_16579 [Aphelenchoides avenae]|nr:hypothetical protein AAVH_16579 [Aphelenchus avenae]